MNDLQRLADRWRDTLLPGIGEPASGKVRPDHLPVLSEAERLAASQGSDGSWSDIDYDDPAIGTSWPCAVHVDRLAALARGYRVPGLDPARRQVLHETAVRGLDLWLRRDPIHWNWWYNQIGIPMPIGAFLLLMAEDLSTDQVAGGTAILARGSWRGATGANLTWLAGIQVVRGCVEGRSELVAEAMAAVAGEVHLALPRGEGIQADWSFHQHGEILISGSYGAAFAIDSARLAALAAGTRFAFTEEQIRLLSGYMLDGQQWMIRGPVFDYGCVGREICRRGKDALALAEGCRAMVRAGVPRRDEFAAFAARLETPQPHDSVLVGNRHYWKSDFMVHHRRGWYSSARMHSTRVDNTDSCCTNENRKSHLIADGVNLLLRTGNEYRDIFPVWDWKRLPGVTADLVEGPYIWQTVRQRAVRDLVGGVSDGLYGCAYMDLARWNTFAAKGWFFFDEEYVCLGNRVQGGIFAPSDTVLVTSVDQRHLAGEVTVSDADGMRVLPKGKHRLSQARWVHHDGVGYLFPAGGQVVVGSRIQTGRWTEIGQEPEGEVCLEVFSLWLDHGPAKKPQTYQYVVVPEIDVDAMDRYATAPSVEVLQNDASMAIRHRKLGLVQAAFAVPGSLDAGDGLVLGVDLRCLLLCHETTEGVRLAVANPLNLPGRVTVTVDRSLQGEGCTFDAATGVSSVVVDLPEGELAGSSVVRELTSPVQRS
ncbi:MAG: polysaccharide lyase family 8 super-sandwich domain-containing protein [Candidatus Latescibacterota bacterium]